MFNRTNLLFCLTVIFFINCNDTESNVENVIPEESDSLWTLIWNEDFNEPTLDNNKWNVLQWRPGWVNNENQAYTDRDTNLYFEDGNLVIRALVEPGYYDQDYQGNSYNSDYTSGRINTAENLVLPMDVLTYEQNYLKGVDRGLLFGCLEKILAQLVGLYVEKLI